MGNWPSEPPAGNPVLYINYLVHCRSAQDCTDLRAIHGATFSRRPSWARDTLSIPETAFGYQIDDQPRAISFSYPPYLVDRSLANGSWLAKRAVQGSIVYPSEGHAGNPYWWPPTSVVWDYDQDWFIIPAHPSVPVWGAGRDTTVIWTGTFLTMGGATSPGPTEVIPPANPQPLAMRKKRFICGFESYSQGGNNTPEGGSGPISRFISRDASRTPEGLGFTMRSEASFFGDFALASFGTVSDPTRSWERFYIRLRKLPTTGATNGVSFMSAFDSGSAQTTSFRISSTGKIQLWNGLFVDAHTLTDGSGANLSLNRWYMVDVLYTYINKDLGGGSFQQRVRVTVYLNHALYFGPVEGSIRAVGGAGAAFNHLQTRLGNSLTGANDMELDIDDWTNQEYPLTTNTDVTLADYELDWIMGQHMMRIRPTSLVSGTGWTGDFRTTLQMSASDSIGTLVSTTSGAKYKVNTEYDGTILGVFANARQQGLIAAVIGGQSIKAGAASKPTTGWDTTLTGEAGVLAISDISSTLDSSFALLSLTDNIKTAPPKLSVLGPLKAFYQKTATADSETLKFLQASGCFLGSWGPEDDIDPQGPGTTEMIGIHNGPFFTSFMAWETPPPLDAIAIRGGTYAGNDVGQDIVINLPAIHWLMIRRVDSSNGPGYWWSSMIDIHNRGEIGSTLSDEMLKVIPNTDGTCTISIVGNSLNATGGTYQITTFCDISSRCLINGAFWHRDTNTAVNTLFRSDFTPELVMLQEERMDSVDSNGFYIKGPGHTGSNATMISTDAQTNNIATFAQAQISSLSALHAITGNSQVAYAAWRQSGGGCSIAPVYIGNYTGDGSGSRALSVNLGGRRPLLAIGHTAGASGSTGRFRDPSHTSTNSSTMSTNISDITSFTAGGIDSVTVGINLNASGVVYNLFIIPGGSDVGGNNGWSINGTFGLCEPGWDAYPPQYPTPPNPPSDIAVVGSGGITISGAGPSLVVQNLSGIYTLTQGKTYDTIYDRQAGQTSVDIKIPDPKIKTGLV